MSRSDVLDPFNPDGCIGYLIRRSHQLGLVLLEPWLAEEGITKTQWSAMALLYMGRCRTSAELARDLLYDKGAMTRLVDTLEANGWLTRERADDDRRVIQLVPTEAGEAITRRCGLWFAKNWEDWLSDWDAAEIDTLLKLLNRLHTTMSNRQNDSVAVADQSH